MFCLLLLACSKREDAVGTFQCKYFHRRDLVSESNPLALTCLYNLDIEFSTGDVRYMNAIVIFSLSHPS